LKVKESHLAATTLGNRVNIRKFKLRVLRTIHLLGSKNLALKHRVSHRSRELKCGLAGVNRLWCRGRRWH